MPNPIAAITERGSFSAWLPRTFWDDHAERCWTHEGVRREVEIKTKRVLVELDRIAFDDLLSDADLYSTEEGWDENWDGKSVRRSARRTLEILKQCEWSKK